MKHVLTLLWISELFPDSEHSQNLPTPKMIAKALKQAQPYRERPSKDRSRRFMVGELPLDHVVNDDHDLITNQFWTIHPSNTVLHSAKVFLLSHILYIAESGKPKNSSIKSNLNPKTILNMYDYDKKTKLHHSSGQSGLVQASRTLITNVTNYYHHSPWRNQSGSWFYF